MVRRGLGLPRHGCDPKKSPVIPGLSGRDWLSLVYTVERVAEVFWVIVEVDSLDHGKAVVFNRLGIAEISFGVCFHLIPLLEEPAGCDLANLFNPVFHNGDPERVRFWEVLIDFDFDVLGHGNALSV